QSFAPPPRHPAPRQVSPVVQRLPSSHVVPSCSGSFWHPYTGLQASDVQVLPSSQVARAGRRQWGSQPSQSAVLPSSHSSGNSGGAPLPHAGQGTRQPSGTSARVVGSRPVHSGRTKPAGHGARGGLMILAPAVCGGVLEHAVLVPVWRVVRTAPLTVIPLRPITSPAAPVSNVTSLRAVRVTSPPGPPMMPTAFMLTLEFTVNSMLWLLPMLSTPPPLAALPSSLAFTTTSTLLSFGLRSISPASPLFPLTSRPASTLSVEAASRLTVPPEPALPVMPPLALTGAATVRMPATGESVVRSTSPLSPPGAPS